MFEIVFFVMIATFLDNQITPNLTKYFYLAIVIEYFFWQ